MAREITNNISEIIITRGIYAKHHIMLLPILIGCVEEFFCTLCNMMSQLIRRISTVKCTVHVQYTSTQKISSEN